MQRPPNISTELYEALALPAQPLNLLMELYDPDEVPTANGFNPDNAVLRLADTQVADFLGNEYDRYITDCGKINRTITSKFNTVSVTLDNHDRTMAEFVLTNDIEGMFLVLRLISRAITATALDDSLVIFVGKCDAVFDADNDSVVVSARQYIGSTEEEIPWRTCDPDDELGRLTTDVLFEGFLFRARPATITAQERVRRGGFLGLLGFKKTVTRTLQYTTKQGVEVEKSVPFILGRAQAQLIPIAYVDVGGQINAIFLASEGPIKKFFDLRIITSGFRFASVSDGNPNVDQFRYGYDGNTNGQVPFLDNLTGGIPANGYYSRSAMFSTAFYGTDVLQDDPAPDVICVLMGSLIDLPDDNGDFTISEWNDNPAYQTRFVLTHPRIFNLDPVFINDPQCIKTACYCDDPVLDETNGELIVLPNTEEAAYGVSFRRYRTTGLFTPEYFKHYFLGIGQDPLPELVLPTEESGIVTFYDPTAGAPTLTPLTLVRRRFTSNIYLAEQLKTVDFLFKILLPSFRGYITQNAKGKLDIKCRRPGDNTIIRSAVTAGDDLIAVNSILAWVASLDGYVIVGSQLLTSEVRQVIDTSYTTAANGITLAVSAGLSASGSNFSGGTSSTPATATITVTGLGTLTVTIDGLDVTYETVAADSVDTAAAMLTQFLKANTTLNSYIKFVWDKNTPDEIYCESKMGFLTLSSQLEEDHDLAEEVLRIELPFSDRLYTPSDLQASNILRGSVKWPIGSRQTSINRVDGSFNDAPQDFRSQKIRTRDQTHIDRTKKTVPYEMTLTAVDNFSQAKRLELSELAEKRDLNFFMQQSSDRLALLIEEGDLICNTHASGAFRNLPLRVEEISINPKTWTVDITGRRYTTAAYSDVAPQRNVPLPTSLGGGYPPDVDFYYPAGDEGNQGNAIFQSADGTTLLSVYIVFGRSLYGQVCKIRVSKPPGGEFELKGTVTPDANNRAVFQFNADTEGTWTIQLEVCTSSGTEICNPTKPEATVTIAFGVVNSLLYEDTAPGALLTEAGDYLSIQY